MYEPFDLMEIDELRGVLAEFYQHVAKHQTQDESDSFTFVVKLFFRDNVDRFLETVRHYFSKNHCICNDTVTSLYCGAGDPKCYIVDIYAEKEPEYTREKK